MLQKLIIGVLVLLVLFTSLLYLVVRTNKKNVSQEPPFAELVGKTVLLKRPVWLIRNRQAEVHVNPYVLTEPNVPFSDEAALVQTLPVGTQLRIDRVLLLKNGVSGRQTALVVGTWSNAARQLFPFEYEWGTYHFLNEEYPYWTFPAAPWQTEPDTHRYSLPTFWF